MAKREDIMKTSTSIICVILLVVFVGSFALSGNASQAGGLPALALRVQTLEGQVANLISQVGATQNDVAMLKNVVKTIQNQVFTLQNVVASLHNTVANLGTEIGDLQGQNNWAVVSSTGIVVRHSGNSSVTGSRLGVGSYYVTFTDTDTTKCAYIATIRGATPGFITVTAGISTGGTPSDVQVQTFDKNGSPADAIFHLYVSCP
jgi:outer membrane murein-binding lipoprotein Lpp